ncbi:hypothetical protein N9Z02_02225 [Akkermansiaceae bacterium]|nr:hypothetical protein [Akkermansiaceae bacterium]
MKTTLELPALTLRKAKAFAASQGITLKAFFTEALEEKLRAVNRAGSVEAPWMEGFGKLSDLSEESREVMSLIEEEFESIEAEDIA